MPARICVCGYGLILGISYNYCIIYFFSKKIVCRKIQDLFQLLKDSRNVFSSWADASLKLVIVYHYCLTRSDLILFTFPKQMKFTKYRSVLLNFEGLRSSMK